MPYDIRIFRGDEDAPTPIPPAELAAVLRGAREAAPGEWRVWAGDVPWFVAYAREDGSAVLSMSYTNPAIEELVPRFGAEAARVGHALGATVVEEVGANVLTPDTVGETYAPGGALVTHLEATVRGVWAGISQECRAPLDFPVGPYDLVSEHFMFHLRGAPDASERAVVRVLGDALGAHRVRREGNGAVSLLVEHAPPGLLRRWFGGPSQERALVKVLVRPDGVVQIWPWWDAPLAVLGPLAVDAASRLHGALGGELSFHGLPWDGAREGELRGLFTGTLTDLWLWTRRLVAEDAGLPA